MNGRIEWDVAADPLRACLMVEVKERGLLRPATLDDLKRACEAVGLHVVDRVVFDAIVAKSESNRVRAEKAEGELSEVVGLFGGDTAIEGAVAACRSVNELVDQKHVLARDLADRTRESIGYQSANENMHETIATLSAQLAEAEAQHAATQDATLAKSAYISKLESKLAALTTPEGRATDEELYAVFNGGIGASRENAIRLVAARVRRERPACLVERLVAARFSFDVEPNPNESETFNIFTRIGQEYRIPAADVPATLARLAGLDGGR